MRTIVDRSTAAEGCKSLVDIIDDWVRGLDAETTAERILNRLPQEIQEALRAHCYQSDAPRRLEDEADEEIQEFNAPGSLLQELLDGDAVEAEEIRAIAAAPRTVVEPVDVPSTDYELVITDQAFEPSYGGWNVQFQAVGAPRLAHQSSDPSLEAFVRLEIVDTSKRLASGRGTAMTLVRDVDEPSRQALSILTGTSEGNILATGLGAASIDTGQVTEVPRELPNDERLLAAMKKSLEVHLQKVRDERARLKVTEAGAGFVGKSFKVKL